MEYLWPGNIRELENLVKRYVIVGNETSIIRELSTHKPIVSSLGSVTTAVGPTAGRPDGAGSMNGGGVAAQAAINPIWTQPPASDANGSGEMLSLLEIGRRAAMKAEREAIERVLTQTRWNRRQAAKILKISYKALLNKLKVIEEQNQAQMRQTSS